MSVLVVATTAAALIGCADTVRQPPAANLSSSQAEPGEAPTIPVGSYKSETENNVTQGLARTQLFPGTGNFIDQNAASLPAIEETPAGEVILNFAEVEIANVVRSILGQTLDVNYLMDSRVQGTVTMQTARPLPRDALIPTLETVLRVHGAAIVRSENFYKIVPLAEAPRAVPRPELAITGRLKTAGFGVQILPLQFISASEMEKILRPFAPAGGILRVDSSRNLLLLAGTRQELANMVDTASVFDVDWMTGMSVGMVPLQTAEPSAVIEDLNKVFGADAEGPLAGMVRFAPIERLNSILVISKRADYLDRAQVWIERLDGGVGSEDRRLYVYLVQNGRAADLANVLTDIFGSGPTADRADTAVQQQSSRLATTEPQGGQDARTPAGTELKRSGDTPDTSAANSDSAAATRDRPASASPPNTTSVSSARSSSGSVGGAGSSAPASATGIGLPGANALRIIADERNNALLILANGREYQALTNALRKLDIQPLQVLIEATIAEVRLSDELRYGLQWFFQSGRTSFTLSDVSTGAVASTFPGFSFVFSKPDITVVLDALSEVTDVNVISSPQLMVLDNASATLQVGDQVPIATQQAVDTGDTGAPLVNTIQFRDTGVILTVTPRVNAGGLIQMEISQEVSDVTRTTTSNIDSPTVRQRKIQSSVVVQTGETIALGGLIRNNKEKGRAGVPILSDLPVVGALFGTTAEVFERTELLVLITPRVVRNQREARTVTDELRQRMRAVEPLGQAIR